jgi:hypothetical protein
VRVARIALYDRVSADTVAGTVIAGSTTSVVKMTTGHEVYFAKGDVANITGTGASVANHRRVVLVTAVDTTIHTVTVSPALSVAPRAGDVLGMGWRQWALTPADSTHLWLYAGPLYGEHPAMGLLRAASSPPVVGIVAELTGERAVGNREEPSFRLRILGSYLEWVEGAAARVRALLDARQSAVTMVTGVCHGVTVGQVTAPIRTDELIERVLPVQFAYAPALVA